MWLDSFVAVMVCRFLLHVGDVGHFSDGISFGRCPFDCVVFIFFLVVFIFRGHIGLVLRLLLRKFWSHGVKDEGRD